MWRAPDDPADPGERGGRAYLDLQNRVRREKRGTHLVAGSKKTGQMKDYSRVIVEDPVRGAHAAWDFMLVNDSKCVRKDIYQVGCERGILDQSEIDPDSPVN